MRDFSFSQTETNDQQDIERILRERKRKIYKQQFIYSVILAIIIAAICVWLYRKSVYVEFDGYVSADYYTFRTDEDVYFLDSKWRVGDLILPGDTVFSYVIANNFYKHESNDYEPTILVRDRDMRVQYGVTRQDLNVLQVRISELERQLAVEDHNIKFGLSDNHNKLRTEQELSETREQYKALRKKLGILWNAITQGQQSVQRLTNGGHGYLRVADMRNVKLLDSLGVVRHSIAVDSSIVTEKLVPTYSLVLRGEPIMTSQGLNLADNNVSVVAYVKPDQMKYINYHTKANVIVTDKISYTASVLMLGARTEEIPGELRSTLSRDHTASIVVFNIDPDQDVPFWSLINGLPVMLRINKFREGTSNTDDYIIFNTTYGIDINSINRWRANKETIQEWNDENLSQEDSIFSNPHSRHVNSQSKTSPNPQQKESSSYHSISRGSAKTPAASATQSPASAKPKAATAPAAVTPAKPTASAPAKPTASTPANLTTPSATTSLSTLHNAKTGSFHIIVGSSPERDFADSFVDKLRKQGFAGARVIVGDGRFRISIASFSSPDAASAAVVTLTTETDYKSAWVSHQIITNTKKD
ncbi:MAG: SPOR domain-containing protein [Bacteroides sp.]|nr:SPOR domain-containing protein [Bacteroides sp.]